MKKILIIILFTIVSFTAGYIISNQAVEEVKASKSSISTTPSIQVEPATVDKMPETTQKRYYELVAEYIKYTKDNESYGTPMSFSEFLSSKRDKLIQENKYSSLDEKIYGEIFKWYENINNGIHAGSESFEYNVRGDIYGVDLDTINNTNMLVGTYLEQTAGHVASELPLSYCYINDDNKSFDMKMTLKGSHGIENQAIYLYALAIPKLVPYNVSPIMRGYDEKINGLSPSLLSKRRSNEPASIKMRKIKDGTSSQLTISSLQPGLMLSMYGVESISSIDPDINISRTTITTQDGIARFKSIGSGSSTIIEAHNSFRIKTSILGDTNIEFPATRSCDGANCLLVIKPHNIDVAEVTIYANCSKLVSHTLNTTSTNKLFSNIYADSVLLELNSDNNTLGLMKVDLYKEGLLIIEPHPTLIKTLRGRIKKISTGPKQKKRPCVRCNLTAKYSDSEAVTTTSGAFYMENLKSINDSIYINIDSGDIKAVMNIPVMYPQKELVLNIEIPSISLVNAWSAIAPTTPNNTTLYGQYPYDRNYRVFAVGVDMDVVKEALYINSTGYPDKSIKAANFYTTDAGYGRFFFNNLPLGEYVLYFISNNKIIHSRLVSTNKGRITIVD